MRIAIIGAGFCGLAVAWHLSQHPNIQITIFDPNGIGNGASGVAAGLLHPYAGARATRSWRCNEGLAATLKLLKIAERALNQSVHFRTGFLRFPQGLKQEEDFKICSEKYSDVHWKKNEEVLIDFPYVSSRSPCIYIDSALTIDCKNYLRGLWLACQKKGVLIESVKIGKLSELENYDHVVLAIGAATLAFPELQHLPITPIKGQIITLDWPFSLIPLPYPLSRQAYVLMNPQKRECIVGATFERDFFNEQPDNESASKELLPKNYCTYSRTRKRLYKCCRSGIRASTPDHRPIIKQINKNHWIITEKAYSIMLCLPKN